MKGTLALGTFCFIFSLVRSDCGYGWKSYRESCYLFVQRLEDWADAQRDCERRNGWLVDIVDAEENAFIHSHMPVYWNWHFIGLSDEDDEGTFRWSNGYSMEYNNFWPGEPNNSGGNEDCVEMRYSGLWNDVSCNKQQYYICERSVDIKGEPTEAVQETSTNPYPTTTEEYYN